MTPYSKYSITSPLFMRTYVLFIVVFILFAFLPFVAEANHSPRFEGRASLDPCPAADRIPKGSTGSGDVGGGLFVPVKDLTVMQNSFLTTLNTAEIQRFTGVAALHLRQLCEKEFEYDHTIQHAWSTVIGKFISLSMHWVQTAYNSNAAFATNLYSYYQLVDEQVFLTYLQEITDSNIGSDTKRAVLRGLIYEKFAYIFPYTLKYQLAQDDTAKNLATDNTAAGGAGAMHNLRQSGANTLDATQLARSEFERRRQEAQTFEQDKLNWGRGFYSYEVCDLKIFGKIDTTTGSVVKNYDEDRRNCRVVTPGSVIQEQTSLMLGSGLRQMELADEYEEWVSAVAITVTNDVLNYNGLAQFNGPTPENDVGAVIIGGETIVPSSRGSRGNAIQSPVSPTVGNQLIIQGNHPVPEGGGGGTISIFPTEFTETINNPEETNFKASVLNVIGGYFNSAEVQKLIPGFPPLN